MTEPDIERLAELVAEYGSPRGERSRVPLLQAMEQNGAAVAVGDLAASADPAARRLAGRLAELLPDSRHIPALERLAADPDPDVARSGLDGLATQVRDPAWQQALGRVANGPDPETARRAARLLGGAAT